MHNLRQLHARRMPTFLREFAVFAAFLVAALLIAIPRGSAQTVLDPTEQDQIAQDQTSQDQTGTPGEGSGEVTGEEIDAASGAQVQAEDGNQQRDQKAAPVETLAKIGTFRIAILTGTDPQRTRAAAEPFRLAIADKLSIPVDLALFADYTRMAEAAMRGRIEYAVMPAAPAAAIWTRCRCFEPLVVARSAEGAQSFRQVIIADKNGPASVQALSGERVATAKPPAFGGADLALHELRQAGIGIGGDVALDIFAGSELALDAFLEGRAQALLGWSTLNGDPAQGYSAGTLRTLALRTGDATPFKVIWQSSPLPNRLHLVRIALPGDVKARLRDLLGSLFANDPAAYDSIEPAFGGGFVPARQSLLDPLVAMIEKSTVSKTVIDTNLTGNTKPAPQGGAGSD